MCDFRCEIHYRCRNLSFLLPNLNESVSLKLIINGLLYSIGLYFQMIPSNLCPRIGIVLVKRKSLFFIS